MHPGIRLALLVALVAGCETQPTPEAAPTVIRSAPPRADTEAPAGISAEDRARRRQAALDLLTDGHSAAKLPIAASEPDQKFEPRLAEELAPKVWVSDGFGGSGKLPQVRQGKPTVQGSLDSGIIRQIVRAHINEVRSCYKAGQSKDRKLAGRVTINFVIGGDGKVKSSVVEEHTLPDTSVANCIAKAVKRWTFPKPIGGTNVIVSYPFILESG